MVNHASNLATLCGFYLVIAAVLGVNSVAAQESEQTKKATSTLSGADAVRAINWDEVKLDSAIPHLMPAGDSDDPVEAGFAPQWIEHALVIHDPKWITLARRGMATVPAEPLALQMIAEKRDPTDSWAHTVDRKIRDTIRTNGGHDSLVVWRVFCGSHGCLCYLEFPAPPNVTPDQLDVAHVLRHELTADNGWGRKLGISPLDVYDYGFVGPHDGYGGWDLIYIVRPTEK